ncbi:MAG: hypothetical protein R3D26_14670 [Cyanobacteriota/Melainabacteria group bacterium]
MLRDRMGSKFSNSGLFKWTAEIDSTSWLSGISDGGLYFGSSSRYTPLQVFNTYVSASSSGQDLPGADPVLYGVRDTGR